MTLAIEAFAQTAGADGVSSSTVPLNTLGMNRICLCIIHTDAATRRSVTGVTGGSGLTWALYSAQDWDSADTVNHKQRLEVWWAYAAAQQTSQTITVTLSGNSNGPSLVSGSIANVDPSRFTGPFDADASEPNFVSNPTGTAANATGTFSTHDSASAAISVYATNLTSANLPAGAPSGYTLLANLTYAGTVRLILYVGGKVYAAQQVGTTVAWGSLADWGVLTFSIGGDVLFPHSQVNCAGF